MTADDPRVMSDGECEELLARIGDVERAALDLDPPSREKVPESVDAHYLPPARLYTVIVYKTRHPKGGTAPEEFRESIDRECARRFRRAGIRWIGNPDADPR